MGHQDGGRRVESCNETAALFVERKIHRSDHRRQTAGVQPSRGRVNQSLRGFGIIHTVEKAKMSAVVAVKLEITAIDLG